MSLADLKGNGEQGKTNESGSNKSQKSVEGATSDKKAGRPEKEDGQKSEKTIQNKESMS